MHKNLKLMFPHISFNFLSYYQSKFFHFISFCFVLFNSTTTKQFWNFHLSKIRNRKKPTAAAANRQIVVLSLREVLLLIKYILFISFLRGGQICYLLRLPDKKKSNGGGGLVDWVAASGEKKWKKIKRQGTKKRSR